MGKTALLRLLDSYFRHRWLYLLPVVLLTIAAGIYLVTFNRLYISRGVIYTEQSTMLAALTSVQEDGFSWNTPAQDISNQFADLFRTDAFIRAVIQQTDLEAEMNQGEPAANAVIKEVRKRIWVTITGNNQVQVNAANEDPNIAYQLAHSTIDTFLNWKINLDRIDSVTAENFLQQLIVEYRADVDKAQQALRSYLEEHPDPLRGDRPEIEVMEIKNLQMELDFAGTRLSRALEKAENARLAESQVESNVRQKYTIVDAPDLPEKPATSKREMALNGLIFVAAGVLLSCIAVVGATLLEQSFRFPMQVSNDLDLPVLAIVPDVLPARQEPRRRARKKPSETEELQETLLKESSEASTPVEIPDEEVPLMKVQKIGNRTRGIYR